jgi:hypothetical protein
MSGLLAVEVSESASPPGGPARPDVAVLDALVVNSLEIADETDPLLRAKSSVAVSQALADAVQRSALRGETAQAARFKVWMERVLELGVRYNVGTVDPTELSGARLKLWKDLSARPQAISTAMTMRLQGLTPPAQQALAEADKKEKDRQKPAFLDFKGWEKGWDKFKKKGKGKPPDDFKGWEKDKGKKKRDQVSLPAPRGKVTARRGGPLPPMPPLRQGAWPFKGPAVFRFRRRMAPHLSERG